MVTLRHFTRDDVDSVQSNQYPNMTAAEIIKMIDEWNLCVYQGRRFEMFAIVSDSRIVGNVSMYERSHSIVSTGIEIYPAERKKGFAAESLAVLAAYASEQGYRMMMDQVRADNYASLRLHDKLGFESDGYVYRNQRNHEVMLYLKRL